MDSQSPSVQPTSAEQFLRTVLRSRLLTREELQAALRDVPRGQRDSADALAEHLIRAGKLSRFQARKLLKGIALGLVLGPYQILAPLGKGGMGKVFLARDARSAQLLAVKVLPPRKARHERRQLTRFLREIALNQRVHHPHLATTFAAGQLSGVYYLAMEFIPGRTLTRLVAAEGPLRVARAARLLAEVAEGLHAAHEQGIIHRDLKPSNIMVTPHDHAKVLDLGLAMVEGEEVADVAVVGGKGYIVGTMDYIAPEQTTDAAAVDRRSDIYSLGCTLYFAVTGRPPFPGGDSRDKIRRHRHEAPEPLGKLRPDLPAAFVGLIEIMMEKDPKRRFPTMAEVIEELRPWAAGEQEQPLDQPDDTEYREALAVAQQTEQLPEGSATDLPVLEEEENWFAGDSATRTFWLAFAMAMVGALLVGLGFAAFLLLGGGP
jgi:serine/threonine protein kinase